MDDQLDDQLDDVLDEGPVPIWAALLWWVVCAIGAFIGFGVATIVSGLSCDTYWEGCDETVDAALAAYRWVAIVGFGALLAVIMLKPTRRARIVATLLVTAWIPVCILAYMAVYAVVSGTYR